MKKKCRRGFTLLELTVAMAIIATITAASLTVIDSIRTQSGLSVSSELRTLHLAQKHYLIEALDQPGSIDLSSLTIVQLQNRGLAPTSLPSIEKTGINTVRVNLMPPTCSLDGTKGDQIKSSKSTGDNLYDIGPE